MVHKAVEHVVHHAKVVVTFILLLHVHQIFIQSIEPGGQHFCDAEACFRRGSEKLAWIFDEGKGTWFYCANRDVVWAAQQNVHLTEERPRFRYFRDPHLVSQHLNLPLDQHKHRAARSSLFKDNAARIKILIPVPGNQF